MEMTGAGECCLPCKPNGASGGVLISRNNNQYLNLTHTKCSKAQGQWAALHRKPLLVGQGQSSVSHREGQPKALVWLPTWDLKNAPLTFVHRGNTVPQPLTFLKLEFGRALLMVIQVSHCLVFALAVLLSVRGMTDFSEHWDNTSYPDDTQ